MNTPLQVTFHGIPASDAMDSYVRERASKLDTLCDRIVHLGVAVEAPHHRRRYGQPYRVRIDLRVPGEALVVDRPHGDDRTREDAYAAIDAAFDEAARRLDDYVKRRHSRGKTHARPLRGRIVKLYSYEGYGFLETSEGERLYFHRNSVLHSGFARMRIGSVVTFVPEDGDQGPQASTVVLRHA